MEIKDEIAVNLVETLRPKIKLDKLDSYGELPSKAVKDMSGDDFEQYITEWLYTVYQGKKYHTGKKGDGGVDHIILTENDELEYIQCKREKGVSGEFTEEIVKTLNNVRRGLFPMPKRYRYVATNGVPSKWAGFLEQGNMKEKLLMWYKNQDLYEKEAYEGFEEWMKDRELPEIDLVDINRVYTEHLKGPYGFLRFGNEIGIERKESSRENENGMHYIREILKAYSEHLGKHIDIEDLKDEKRLAEDLDRQKSSYYSAEGLRITANEYLEEEEFGKLKEEIYDGIIENLNRNHADGYDRMLDTLTKATHVELDAVGLSKRYGLVNVKDRKGICHMLVEDRRFGWCNDE